MAERTVSFSERQFYDHLTCGVCLDQYTNPKTLPCHHSFCLECIKQLPVEIKEDKYINCPLCFAHHQLPEGGAINLPHAFLIQSFLDLQFTSLPAEKDTKKDTEKDTKCSKHNDPLKVFCETCSQVICHHCTISQQHNTHKFHLISECYARHHQQIMASLDLLKCKTVNLGTAVTNLDIAKKEALQHGQHIKEQINTHAQQLIQQIQTSQTHLSQQVDTIVEHKTQVLSTQKQLAQNLHTQLNTCQQMIEHSLKEWTQQQILTNKHTMMDEMNTITKHVDSAVFQPLEKSDIHFKKLECKKIGVIMSTKYKKAKVKIPSCQPQNSSKAILTLQLDDGSPFSPPLSLISSQLSSPANEHSVKCDITRTNQGIYNITFTPSTRHDQLIVQVGGVEIPDSPFTLPVIPTPEMRDKPVNTITGLNKPYGIAVCDNGDIVVAERDAHCITILNKDGKKVKSFGTYGTKKGQYICPCGVAISIDGHILITDNHRLQKITADGACAKSVGSCESGSGQLEFKDPKGITVHPTTGDIFVSDDGNNRIQVFTCSLAFSHTITRYINNLIFTKTLSEPNDVALDKEGYLYVAEFGNHCITKCTTNGDYIKRFGSEGSNPSQLYRPFSLTVHNNLVYVSERGNDRVSIFDTSGTFVHCFGQRGSEKGQFKSPCGITIDAIGMCLYVSDTFNNKIAVH